MNVLQKLLKGLVQFCTETAIHGFSYMVLARNRKEGLFWILVMLVNVTWSLYEVARQFISWRTLPVIISIQSYTYPVEKMPFPTVTICPKQTVDELHSVAMYVNQFSFNCRYETDGGDCDDTQALRQKFNFTLAEISSFYDEVIKGIETRFNWKELANLVLDTTTKVEISDPYLSELFAQSYAQARESFGIYIDGVDNAGYEAVGDSSNNTVVVSSAHVDEYPLTENLLPPIIYRFAQKYMNGAAKDDTVFKVDGNDSIIWDTLNTVKDAISFLGGIGDLETDMLFINFNSADDCEGGPYCKMSSGVLELSRKLFFTSGLDKFGLGSLLRYTLANIMKGNASFDHIAIQAELYSFLQKENFQQALDIPILLQDPSSENAFYKWNASYGQQTEQMYSQEECFRAMRVSNVLPNAYLSSNHFRELISRRINYSQYYTRALDFGQYISPYTETYLQQSKVDNHHLSALGLAAESDILYLQTFLKLEQFIKTDFLKSLLSQNEPAAEAVYKVGTDLQKIEMLRLCEFDSTEGCQAQFFHTLTSQGVCGIFNGSPFWQSFKETEYNKLFAKYYSLKKEQGSLLRGKNLRVFIDLHSMDIRKPHKYDSRATLAIGSSGAFFDAHSKYTIILPGIKSTVKVAPRLHSPGNDIMQLDPEVRGCRTPNSHSTNLFKQYFPESCIQECKIGYFSSITKCRPWDIPPIEENSNLQVCSGQEALIFHQHMAVSPFNDTALCQCHMPSCTEFIYDYNTDSVAMDPKQMCRDKQVFESIVVDWESVTIFQQDYSQVKGYLLNDKSILDYCYRKITHDIGYIQVDIVKSHVVQTLRHKVTSFVQEISLVGGTICLFNGFSMMVLIEVLYFIYISMVPPQCKLEPPKKSSFSQYCELTSIHGFKYILTAHQGAVKLVWILSIIVLTVLGNIIVWENLVLVLNNPFEQIQKVNLISDMNLAYPTITICNEQLNDKWNLVRLLLNQEDISPSQGQESSKLYEDWKPFFEGLVYNPWLPDQWMGKSDYSRGQYAIRNLHFFKELLFESDQREFSFWHISNRIFNQSMMDPKDGWSHSILDNSNISLIDLKQAMLIDGLHTENLKSTPSIFSLSIHVMNCLEVHCTKELCFSDILSHGDILLCNDLLLGRYVHIEATSENGESVYPDVKPTDIILSHETRTCPKNWTRVDKFQKCYEMDGGRHHFSFLTHECQKKQAQLLTIESSQVQDYVTGTFSFQSLFLGLKRSGNADFKWSNRRALDFSNWRPGEPDRKSSEEFKGFNAAVLDSNSGYWYLKYHTYNYTAVCQLALPTKKSANRHLWTIFMTKGLSSSPALTLIDQKYSMIPTEAVTLRLHSPTPVVIHAIKFTIEDVCSIDNIKVHYSFNTQWSMEVFANPFSQSCSSDMKWNFTQSFPPDLLLNSIFIQFWKNSHKLTNVLLSDIRLDLPGASKAIWNWLLDILIETVYADHPMPYYANPEPELTLKQAFSIDKLSLKWQQEDAWIRIDFHRPDFVVRVFFIVGQINSQLSEVFELWVDSSLCNYHQIIKPNYVFNVFCVRPTNGSSLLINKAQHLAAVDLQEIEVLFQDEASCPDGYIKFPDSHSCLTQFSAHDHYYKCDGGMAGHYPVVHNEEQNQFLTDFVGPDNFVILCLSNDYYTSAHSYLHWSCIDNAYPTWANWAPDAELDLGYPVACVIMDQDGFWHDDMCVAYLKEIEYICEKDMYKMGQGASVSEILTNCGKSDACKELIKAALQLSVIEEPLTALGSLIQHFSETVLGHSFHADPHVRENRLFYQKDLYIHYKIYNLLLKLAEGLFDDPNLSYIPLHELPLLLEPIDYYHKGRRKYTEREVATRRAFKLHELAWRKSLHNDTIGIKFSKSRYQNNLFEGLEEDHQDVLRILNEIFHTIDTTFTSNGTKNFELEPSLGEDVIGQAYLQNLYGKDLQQHIYSIMRIMRFSQSLANMEMDVNTFLDIYGQSVSVRNASMLQADMSRLDFVVQCEEGIDAADCTHSFSHIPTNYGICSAYNAFDLDQLWAKDNNYLAHFKQVFNAPRNTKLKQANAVGKKGRISLILDTHQSEVYGSERGSFKIALNPASNSFNVNPLGFTIWPGRASKVYMSISQFHSSEAIKDYPLSKRQCKFPDEVPSKSMFLQYSKSACVFQCTLEHTFKALGCMPWDMIRPNAVKRIERPPVCTGNMVGYFYGNMTGNMSKNIENLCSHCLSDCMLTDYSYLLDTITLDPNSACQDFQLITLTNKAIDINSVDRFHWHYSRRNRWHYDTYKTYLKLDPLTRCREKVAQDIAFLTFDISRPDVVHLKQEVDYTLVDHIAYIGGTNGIFNGISLTSFVEVVYFMFLGLGCFQCRRRQNHIK